ncbi:M1 family aminopeptidase [Endozoicomonas lisbonensis]|uniref:Aminopeptidase N n=1 Tax=Endozoicomonas lisbonensis TaxID=3120522 RepID=A0ABV2SCL7_9GAMM
MLRYCLTLLSTVLIRAVISIALLTGLTSCQSSAPPEQNARKVQVTVSEPSLTLAQAQQRKAMIRQASYDVYLDITDGEASEYSGRITIHLDLHKADNPLTVDFQQGQIHRLLVNSNSLTPDYNGQLLTLPRKSLKTGENTIEIEFTHTYSDSSNSDTGLTKFTDPEDNNHYLYSQPGVYATSQILPLFDQPDIKASFRLTVKAPPQWQVITQTQERQAVGGGPERWWYFPETRPVSPHSFSLQAGPFKVSRYEQGKLPIRLLLRQSFHDEPNPRELFAMVDNARVFYQQYLEQPYPFFKYDMVALPVDVLNAEMTSANVVLNEKYLLPEHSADQPETRQQLLEHLAHSWFGGSISMDWWSDQWLMDGLARYLSYMALARSETDTRSKESNDESWSMFHNQVKQSAYFYDQLPAAEPLRHNAEINILATLNSDIKASKAAAVLQLLHHNLGDDAFRQALQQLLQQYADSSTRAQTFFELIHNTSGQPLKNWEKQWLDTSGVQTVSASYQCKKGSLSSLQVDQPAPGKRSQVVHVGLFKNRQSTLQRYRTLPVVIDGKSTKVDIPGQQPCPDFVYPNVDDKGYVRVQLDEQSLKTILKWAFSEPLMQTLIDSHLYQSPVSVRSAMTYATARLPDETNVWRLKSQLTGLKQLSDQLFRLKSANPAVQTVSSHWLLTLEELAWQQLNIAEPDSPLQNLWFDFFLHIAHTDDSAMQLKRLLEGRWEISDLQLTPTRRWQIIIRLNTFPGKTAKNSWDLARREYQKHRSPATTRMYQMADASRPDTLVKSQWLNRLESLPWLEAEAISRVLFPASQYSLVPALRQSIFTALLNNQPERSSPMLNQLISNLLNECSANGVQQLQTFSDNKTLSASQLQIQAQLQMAKQCQHLPKNAVLK